MKRAYPPARRGPQADDYHGTKVADPYRWLEELDSLETWRWVEAENELTFGYLRSVPQRARIRGRLEELWNYERFGLPQQRAGRCFYTRNDGLQNQSVLYVAGSLSEAPRPLLDPNPLSREGVVAISGWRPSEDGRYVAYGLAEAGSDWQQWRVLDADAGRPLPDRLRWIKFSGVSWTPDGEGFYYSRYDAPKPGEQFTGANYYQKLFYHRLGDPQSRDRLVYERKDQKEWGFNGEVTEDGRYLVVGVWRGAEQRNQVFYQNLQTPGAPMVELICGFDAQYEFVGNEGPIFWILTDLNAPRRRLVAVDIRRPERPRWREVVPEAEGVMDMLCYHRFTIGWAWVSEYGSSEDPKQFAALYAYSPLQNIRSGTRYPATLITTADHDDRVVPCHSFKFAAALQAAQAGPAPVLIRIETSAGRGAGTPTSKKIDEETDELAFTASILGGPF